MKKDLETTLLFVIDQTNKMARQYSQREFDLQGIDITIEQWLLLKVLNEHPLLSQNEVAKLTHRDPAAITRTLDLLQKKGLVVREAIIDNRRQYNVCLTKSGSAFVLQNMTVIKGLRKQSIKGFTDADVECLIVMLHKIQRNMK